MELVPHNLASQLDVQDIYVLVLSHQQMQVVDY